MIPPRRIAIGVMTACLLVASVACLPRYKVIDRGPEPYPVERLAREMDPWLLADSFADTLVIEIDWVEGCKPGARTLRGFEHIVRKYVPSDREIEIVLDDEIPLEAWDVELKRYEASRRLAQQYAGTVARHEAGTEKRYVLFVPRYGNLYGVSTHWRIERDGRPIAIDGVIVAREPHEKSAKLWLSRDRFERGTLIHEFGHEFGLVTNDRHERVQKRRALHCNGLTCLMAHPTPRVIVRNAPAGFFNRFPRDYCRRCQEDIRRAQEHWRERAAADPDYRASFQRRREIAEEQVALARMLGEGRFEELLGRTDELRRKYPRNTEWVVPEANALVQLGRHDEALTRLLDDPEQDPHTREYWRQRQQAARLLVGLGRHDEAAGLFDRRLLSKAEAYDFEQSTYVLLSALRGAARYSEAADLVRELLDRRHAISYLRIGMEVNYAGLLRLSGRLEDAEVRVARGLRSRKLRGSWRAEAWALRKAQGRDAEARELLLEMLELAEDGLRSATAPRSRWAYGWSNVYLSATAGDLEGAAELADVLERDGDPEEMQRFNAMTTKAPAWIALGELDRAAELVAALDVHDRGVIDPCGLESLDPLRSSARHAYVFETCPPRTSAD